MGEPDHQFPWIETEGMFDDAPERLIRCTRCGQSAEFAEWISFVTAHSECEIEGEIL
jgi:hypothetical protein